jgi:DNA-binding transcriptional LysR family regulator
MIPRLDARRFTGVGMMPIRKPPSPPTAASQQIDWMDLKFLLVVGETGSFTKAARRLHTTQPTVSKRIDELEHRLGVVLIVRNKNGVLLTEAGRIAMERAAAMERESRALFNDVAMRDHEPAGIVSLACPDGLSTYLIAPALARFQRAYPEIRIMHRAKPDPSDEADLSIQFDPTKRMSDVAIELGYVHYAHFASKEYLDLYGPMQSVFDALDHRMLTHFDYREQQERWRAKIGPLREIVDPAFTSDCSPCILAATAAGAGVATMPTYVAQFEPRVAMLDTGVHARLQFWLVFDRERGELARYKQAIKWLRSVFDPRANPWFRGEFIDPKDFASMISEPRPPEIPGPPARRRLR